MLSTPAPQWIVGGLGHPYDDLIAAALACREHEVDPLGALDVDAMRRGRAALPRGQCAPLLALTGAMLRRVETHPKPPVTFVGVASCGPCRYALFGSAWRQLLGSEDGHQVVMLGQSMPELARALGEAGAERVLDAMLVADALVQAKWQLWPQVQDAAALLRAWKQSVERVAELIREGTQPQQALASVGAFHAQLARRAVEPRPKIVLIGEPWSLHVDGAAQGCLTQMLCEAGAEVETPPLGLWFCYRLWEQQAVASQAIAQRYAQACEALGIVHQPWPSMEELATWAAPYLSPACRGGYGHVEVGLAARARAQRRGHALISVKSFGCIPSVGVSDAIVPTVLGDEIPFLSLEISEDGSAARESRLMLLLACAKQRAEREALDAQTANVCSPPLPPSPPPPPPHGRPTA